MTLYWAPARDHFESIQLGDAIAVFNPLTGDTYFLNELPLLLLELLAASPLSVDGLIARLTNDLSSDAVEHARIQLALEFLQRCELVQSFPD